MRDIFLNAAGDIDLVEGRARLTRVGAEAVGQKARVRLRFWQGEDALDRRIGIPYISRIFGKGTLQAADAILRRAIATTPGMLSLRSFSLKHDNRTRTSSVSFEGVATGGEVVRVEDFRSESADAD